VICENDIKKKLKRENVNLKIYDCTDSTNFRAKEHAHNCNIYEPVLFVANEQSAGRGRLGRSFLSRAGKGIYMSLLYFTEKELSEAVSVTTAAAAIVAEAIEFVTGKAMLIKWVNDIYNDRGKVCGILTESVAIEGKNAIIIGIGINTEEIEFPEELRSIASGIGDLSGMEGQLIARITDNLLCFADDPHDKSYMDFYRARFMLNEKKVVLYVGGERISTGTVLGVDDNGGLIYLPDDENKSKTVYSGEVSVRIEN